MNVPICILSGSFVNFYELQLAYQLLVVLCSTVFMTSELIYYVVFPAIYLLSGLFCSDSFFFSFFFEELGFVLNPGVHN